MYLLVGAVVVGGSSSGGADGDGPRVAAVGQLLVAV